MTDPEPTLAEYPVVIRLPVLWGHMDALRHVNNTVYFQYFEAARSVYGDRIGLFKITRTTGVGPILAATSCKFIKPLRYPDTIRVGCRTVRCSPAELEQEYAVHSDRLNDLAAVGTSRIAAYDYRSRSRSAFPPELLERIRELEPDLVDS